MIIYDICFYDCALFALSFILYIHFTCMFEKSISLFEIHRDSSILCMDICIELFLYYKIKFFSKIYLDSI